MVIAVITPLEDCCALSSKQSFNCPNIPADTTTWLRFLLLVLRCKWRGSFGLQPWHRALIPMLALLTWTAFRFSFLPVSTYHQVLVATGPRVGVSSNPEPCLGQWFISYHCSSFGTGFCEPHVTISPHSWNDAGEPHHAVLDLLRWIGPFSLLWISLTSELTNKDRPRAVRSQRARCGDSYCKYKTDECKNRQCL